MWALIAGGFVFFTAAIVSLGKASSKREEAASGHREELLARAKDQPADESTPETPQTEPIDEPEPHSERKASHPTEQL